MTMHGVVPLPTRGSARAPSDFTPSQTEVLVGLIAARRERNRRFSGRLGVFSDPAWDILVDLLDGSLKGVPISVTSACIASGVPHTTALRYIRILEDNGMISRGPDPKDGRRVYLELTAGCWREVHGYVVWLEEFELKGEVGRYGARCAG